MPSLPFPPPARQVRRKVRISYESWSGCDRELTLWVAIQPGDSEAVVIGKAANAFRDAHGYADRLVSVDIHPQ